MTLDEMAAWLAAEREEGHIDELQMADLLAQRILFDQDRPMIEQEFQQKVVGYVANVRRVDDRVGSLLQQMESFPGRMMYFEAVGRDLY